jgi:hypothetical protein
LRGGINIGQLWPTSCSAPLIELSSNEEEHQESDEDGVITEEEDFVIRQMMDLGVPRNLVVLRTKLRDVGLNDSEEARVMLILDQGASLSAALRSVFQIP